MCCPDNHRNDEINDNIERMERDWEARRDAMAAFKTACMQPSK
jgi:hypothetical protein